MKYLIAVFLFTFSLVAIASSANLSWEAPTTRMDGTALQASEIKEYQIFHEVDGAPSEIDSEVTVVDSGESVTILTLELPPRVEPYVVNFAILTVDTAGLKSPLSEPVSKTFNVNSTAAPGVPTMLEFTINCGEGCQITEVEIK